jgi:hypothetical protein
MVARAILALALAALSPSCGTRAAAPPPPAEEREPDAGGGLLTPSGRADFEAVREQVTDTLEKEHERTLDPKIE